MYLQVSKSGGRPYLSIVHGYRDPVTKKVKHRTIQALGYLDELTQTHPDPVAHFKEVVKTMNNC